ncbi:hypothetical protein C0Q70_07801 [Pomacea canaliculata]|uniref:Uncharacterized protein n=1 Tax=Pomacea canaliculata TaxID=400727 RepID=A0A2T7PG11_POMCA|nr:hypothetical protein C0Q70_07801 [Pomacea canaliculata]
MDELRDSCQQSALDLSAHALWASSALISCLLICVCNRQRLHSRDEEAAKGRSKDWACEHARDAQRLLKPSREQVTARVQSKAGDPSQSALLLLTVTPTSADGIPMRRATALTSESDHNKINTWLTSANPSIPRKGSDHYIVPASGSSLRWVLANTSHYSKGSGEGEKERINEGEETELGVGGGGSKGQEDMTTYRWRLPQSCCCQRLHQG